MAFANIVYPLKFTFIDYPDNISCAVLVQMCGCDKNCDDCQNIELQNKNHKIGTKKFELFDFVDQLLESLARSRTDKVILSGGDPLSETNLFFTKCLITHPKLINIKFCIYTGYDLEDLKKNDIKNIEFVKTGTMMRSVAQASEKTDNYIQFASQNQKLYDRNLNLLSCLGRYYFKKEAQE